MDWRYTLIATVLLMLGIVAAGYFFASGTMLVRVISAGAIGGTVFYLVSLVERRRNKK